MSVGGNTKRRNRSNTQNHTGMNATDIPIIGQLLQVLSKDFGNLSQDINGSSQKQDPLANLTPEEQAYANEESKKEIGKIAREATRAQMLGDNEPARFAQSVPQQDPTQDFLAVLAGQRPVTATPANQITTSGPEGQVTGIKQMGPIAGAKQKPDPNAEMNQLQAMINQIVNPPGPRKWHLGRPELRAAEAQNEQMLKQQIVGALLGRQDELFKGKQPLSNAKREENEIKFANDLQLALAKAGSPDALSIADSAKFALLTQGTKATQKMASLIGDGQDVLLSAPGFLKSQKGRQFQSAMRRSFGAKLRLESGGAINQGEIDEQWKTFAPKRTDSAETIRQKLQSLNEFFIDTINIADPTGIHRKRAGLSGSALDSIPQSALEAEARRRGLLK